MKAWYLSKAIFFGVTGCGGMSFAPRRLEPGRALKKQKTSWRLCRRRLGERRNGARRYISRRPRERCITGPTVPGNRRDVNRSVWLGRVVRGPGRIEFRKAVARTHRRADGFLGSSRVTSWQRGPTMYRVGTFVLSAMMPPSWDSLRGALRQRCSTVLSNCSSNSRRTHMKYMISWFERRKVRRPSTRMPRSGSLRCSLMEGARQFQDRVVRCASGRVGWAHVGGLRRSGGRSQGMLDLPRV